MQTSCRKPQQEPPIWQNVKIGDLSDPDSNNKHVETLQSINIAVHVFEIPIESIKKLRCLWNATESRSLRFKNHYAFRSNAFRAGMATTYKWDAITACIVQAGGHLAETVALLCTSEQPGDLTMAILDKRGEITFIGKDGQTKQTTIGPGHLVLRIKVQRLSRDPQACQLVTYPVFTIPVPSSVPELAERIRSREIAFITAAVTTPISPGQILVLGPEEYYGDESTLGGLFFEKPEPSLFVDQLQPKMPTLKPSVRILAIVCTDIK
jgi:hypothetical protein